MPFFNRKSNKNPVDYIPKEEARGAYIPAQIPSMRRAAEGKDRTQLNWKVFLACFIVLAALVALPFAISSFVGAKAAGTDISARIGDAGDDGLNANEFRISNEDRYLLEAADLDADEMMEKAVAFCDKYFTYTDNTIATGSWKNSIAPYIDTNAVGNYTSASSELKIKLSSEWEETMGATSGAEGKIEKYERIAWTMESNVNFDNDIPSCDITLTLDRPALYFYGTNTPSLEVNTYCDTYHISFTPDGKVFSVKRIKSRIVENGNESFKVNANENKHKNANRNSEENSNLNENENSNNENANNENANNENEEREKAEAEERERILEEARKAQEEAEREAAEAAADAANRANDNSSSGGGSGDAETGNAGDEGGSSSEPEPEPSNSSEGNANAGNGNGSS